MHRITIVTYIEEKYITRVGELKLKGVYVITLSYCNMVYMSIRWNTFRWRKKHKLQRRGAAPHLNGMDGLYKCTG